MSWKDDTELFQLMRTSLYTAIVGDRLDQHGWRHQFLPPECRPLRPDMMVAGRAMTVLETDIEAGQEETTEPFGRMLEALDSLRPNEVYLAAGSSAPYALWGELMSTAARARGATGAVLAGYTRDTRPILAMDFPVFCYGTYAQDQRRRGLVTAYHVELDINGTRVRPGDIVFGDIDGVVVVPRELEVGILEEALEQVRKERKALRDLQNGRLAVDVFRDYGIL
jgi:regulator of RNase E activity RraA